MVPAGAADRDRQVRLALVHVAREEEREEIVELGEELLGLGLLDHVVAHGRFQAGERAQLVDPVGVRKEAAVEDEVGVERHAVLVPERHDDGLHRRRVVAAEQLEQAIAELVHVEVGGVDDDVGAVAHRREAGPLVPDAAGEALGRQRVAAARVLEPADEHVVGRIEEQGGDASAVPLELARRGAELVGVVARLASDDQGDPLGLAPGPADQFGHLAHELDRHVVDHEPAQVVQRVRRRRPPGATHPRDDQKLTHASPDRLRLRLRLPCDCLYQFSHGPGTLGGMQTKAQRFLAVLEADSASITAKKQLDLLASPAIRPPRTFTSARDHGFGSRDQAISR